MKESEINLLAIIIHEFDNSLSLVIFEYIRFWIPIYQNLLILMSIVISMMAGFFIYFLINIYVLWPVEELS